MQLVTEDNITDLAVERWGTARDPRLAELMTALVRHLHDFAREVRLTEAEWMAAMRWLTRTGQISGEKREEFILASDVLGLSMLVVQMNHRLDPAATPDPGDLRAKAVDWMGRHLKDGTVLVYASAPPPERDRAASGAARVIEETMAELARVAIRQGVRRIVIAGGETSGAVVDGLGIDRVVVAREEDRGVPWLVTSGPVPLALLLKSGNFGRPDLLVRAAETV